MADPSPVQLGATATEQAAHEGGWAGSSTPPAPRARQEVRARADDARAQHAHASTASRQAPAVDYFRVGRADGFSLPRVQLCDRRAAGQRQVYWVFQRHLESILYHRTSDGGSTGAIWKMLNRAGLGSTALQVNSAAVIMGQVTKEEYDSLLDVFKSSTEGLDPCSLGRIRTFTLLPLATAAAVARCFGRSAESMAFLRALNQPVPQRWELEEEQEEHAAQGEVDLLLNDQLEHDLDFELEEKSFADELTEMAAFQSIIEDEGKMRTYALTTISPTLKGELDGYIKFRTSTFAARRSGGAVVSATAEQDRLSLLRFLGWWDRTQNVPEPAPPPEPGTADPDWANPRPVRSLEGSYSLDLSMLMRHDLGDLVETYAEWLKDTQKLKFSSIANYINGLIGITSYVYNVLDVPEETLACDPTPLTQLINLRGHAEKASRQQRLYDKRTGGWITWEEVQQVRAKTVQAVEAVPHGDAPTRLKLLREAAAISLLSLLPPDRVGVIRKLRFGHTLKRARDGVGWRIDLTNQKDRHKTSRFYGPFAARLPKELNPVLDAYFAMLSFSEVGGDVAYLFHAVNGPIDRSYESSGWSQYIKRIFERHHGTGISPKTLRASFITWLREKTDDPEILKAAAHAQKHSLRMQESSTYDVEGDTRLVQKAYDFNLDYATTFGGLEASVASLGGGGGGGAGSSGAAGVATASAAAGISVWRAVHNAKPLPVDNAPEATRMLDAAKVGERFAVFDLPDESDASPDSEDAWRPSVMQRTGLDEWSYFNDVDGTTLLETQAHKGDHGVLAEFGMYIRAPKDIEAPPAPESTGAASGSSTLTSIVGALKRCFTGSSSSSSSTVATQRRPRGALPEGWTVEHREPASGKSYKRFHGPNGESAQSAKDAWRLHDASGSDEQAEPAKGDDDAAEALVAATINLGDTTFEQTEVQPQDVRRVRWTFCVPWHDEMLRDGATVRVPATAGLSVHDDLTISLKDVTQTDPVQFTIDAASSKHRCTGEPVAVAVKGVQLLVPAPEELRSGMYVVDCVVDVRTNAHGKISAVLLSWKGVDDNGQSYENSWEPLRNCTAVVKREAEAVLAARVADEAEAAAEQVEPEIEKRQREARQAQQDKLESLGLDQKTLRKQAMKRDADGKYAKPPGRVPKGMRWDGDDGEWVPDPNAETEGESSMGADDSIAPGEQTVEATQVLVPETWEERADEETEAVRATIRSNHLELNEVLGPQPADPSPLAAQAREQLVRSNEPLPGEGEAHIDLAPSAAAAAVAAVAAATAATAPAKKPRQRAAPARFEAGQGGGLASSKRSSSQASASAAMMDGLSLACGGDATDAAPTAPAKQPRHRAAPSRFEAGQGGGLASSKQSSSQASLQSVPSESLRVDDVSKIAVGNLVLAKGYSPTGERRWFEAEVLKLRDVHPRIVVKYLATADGNKLSLLLPNPRIAYVHGDDTQTFSEC